MLCWFFLAWLCSLPVYGTDGTTTDAFVGRYRVVSLSSKPANELMGGIPEQFELTNQTTIFGRGWFQLIAPTATTAPARLHHLWRPHGSRGSVQFGWGM